jgi:hypothetical protein
MRFLLILFLLLYACGGTGDVTETTASSTTTTTHETTVPTTEPSEDDELSSVVEQSRADLATRLNVEESSIAVAEADRVTWRDGALGCPQPGMAYTQALVDGSRVVLEHDGRFYDYHAGADNKPFLCESDAEDGGYDSVPPEEGTV